MGCIVSLYTTHEVCVLPSQCGWSPTSLHHCHPSLSDREYSSEHCPLFSLSSKNMFGKKKYAWYSCRISWSHISSSVNIFLSQTLKKTVTYFCVLTFRYAKNLHSGVQAWTPLSQPPLPCQRRGAKVDGRVSTLKNF